MEISPTKMPNYAALNDGLGRQDLFNIVFMR